MVKSRTKRLRKATSAKFDDDDDMEIVKSKTPEELETMSVISDMRSKANNRARHLPEFRASRGINVNGAQIFKSVANLSKVRRKTIVKKKTVENKRIEKALSIADKQETRVEKEIGKAAVKRRLKNLWD